MPQTEESQKDVLQERKSRQTSGALELRGITRGPALVHVPSTEIRGPSIQGVHGAGRHQPFVAIIDNACPQKGVCRFVVSDLNQSQQYIGRVISAQ